MSQNIVGCALVILPMLGLACLSVAENLGCGLANVTNHVVEIAKSCEV